MTTNNVPVPNFSGIDFNQDFFSSTSGAYVTYPTAQGTVSFPKLLAGEIDSTTPGFSNNMFNTLTGNLNLATNGILGQTLRIGAYTNASVHCASIDHQGNSINHATNASGGTLNICNNMTSGTLNIGTSTTRSGNINIGNGVGASGYVYIGNSTAGTQIGGTLLSTGQITATAGIQSTSGSITTGGNISTTGTGTITSAGNLSMGTNSTVFTTNSQQLRLGYGNTQTTGSATSTFGPFFKSFGPATVSGTTYDITLTGSTDAIFQPTSIDGMGGLFMIMIKHVTSTAKGATFTYSLNKRVGTTGIGSLSLINSNVGGWTTTPTVTGTTGDNLRITFNAADWSGSIVSWTFLGSM